MRDATAARKTWLALAFALFSLATGLRLALMTPIGEVADEPAHIARAAGLLHGEFLGHRTAFRPPGHKKSVTVPAIEVNFGIINAAMGEMGASCTNRAPLAHALGLSHISKELAEAKSSQKQRARRSKELAEEWLIP